MAQQSSPSTPPKNVISFSGISQPPQEPPGKVDKKSPTVDDYRYLAAGLLRQQLPQLMKSASFPTENGDVFSLGRTERPQNRTRATVEPSTKKMRHLAKEMDTILSSVKSKGHTNELLQLFRNTLNNFATDRNHRKSTESGDGRNYKEKTFRSKQIQLQQQKLAGVSSVITAPKPLRQRRCNKEHPKPNASPEMNVLPEQTSVITATVMTKRKIKEPVLNVVGSSKTNVLHRCYGNQNVKATPNVYKNKKSNNGIIVNQRATSAKAKRIINPLKKDKSSTNQQMKTIYENDQYDKSETAVKRCLSEASNTTNDCSSSSSLAAHRSKVNIKPSAMNVKGPKESRDNLTATADVNPKQFHEATPCTASNDTKDTPLEQRNSVHDNSLVQRLTTFWNQKLNTNVKNTTSGHSSIASSITSFDLNSNNSNNLIATENVLTEKNAVKPNVSCKSSRATVDEEGKEPPNDTCIDSEIPDMKMGLMDELIDVLKCKSDSVKEKPDDHTAHSKMTQMESMNESGKETEGGGGNGSQPEYGHNKCANLSSADEDEDSFASEEDDTGYPPVYNYEGIYNDETVEEIETCLMSRITMRESHSTKFSDGDTEYTSENSSRERQANDTGVLHKTDSQNSQQMDEDEVENDSCDADADDGGDADANDDAVVYKYSDCKESSDAQSEPTSEDHGDTAHDVKLIDTGNDSSKAIATKENDSDNGTTSTIMNVNDIINNLRNLIRIIETIPEELKCLNVDMCCLQIPNNLKQTLTLIVEGAPKSCRAPALSADAVGDNDHQSRLQQKHTNDTDEEDEIITIGFRKIAFLNNICHFPSTFTKPRVENILNPVHLIAFPKRNDYLNSKIKQVESFTQTENTDGASETNSESEIENKLLPFRIKNTRNEEMYSYVTRMRTKSKSTVFYVTTNPNAVTYKMPPSLLLRPHKASTSSLNTDVTVKQRSGCELNSEKNESDIELLESNKSESVNGTITPLPANGDIQKTENINDANPEFGMNLIELNLCNDLNLGRRLNNNGNVRRRRLWQQTNIDEDSPQLNGGSGDYGGSVVSFPCHRTSSMSVTVSSSINESASQLDINTNESEHRLRSLPGTKSRSQIEPDNVSIPNVIHEMSEEHLSPRDGCEPEVEDVIVLPSTFDKSGSVKFTEPNKVDGMRQIIHTYLNTELNQSGSDGLGNSLQQALIAELCSSDVKSQDDASTTHASTITLGKFTDNTDDYYGDDDDDSSGFKTVYKKDYIILYCNTEIPKRVQIQLQESLIRKPSDKKYDLEELFKKDPNLKSDLSDIVDLNSLSEKEKQLIAVSAMLLQRNTAIIGRSLLNILMDDLKKIVHDSLKNMTQTIGSKLRLVKSELVIRYQKQKDLLVTRQYKQLMKIIYTTMISLMLCFIIQKNFCGILLPVCFPW